MSEENNKNTSLVYQEIDDMGLAELKREHSVTLLSPKEKGAYEYWKNSDQAPIEPKMQAKMYSLFISGKTCTEIQELHPEYSLGRVVHARVIGEWDEKYQKYLSDLLDTTSKRVMQVTLESANFISDLLTAANKLHGERIKKFLKSGDSKDLDGLEISSIRGYKDAIELLKALTGQDQQKKISGNVIVSHTVTQPSESAPSKEEASQLLKALLYKDKKK